MQRRRYHIITYGCQMNKSDSEQIASVLESKSYKRASNINKANLIVVNMCSVRQSAVDRIWGLIPKLKKLKEKNPKLKTILTGCILKKNKKDLADNFDNALTQPWSPYRVKTKERSVFQAYLPIITGCNNFCSYCVVPYTRGREISKTLEEILSEVKNLIKQEYKEIWLLGENVNSYQSALNTQIHGHGGEFEYRKKYQKIVDFPKLLSEINNIPGNFWIRFTSSHPKDFSDKLISTIAKRKKVTEYINLPVQSGDNQILKKMNRPYTIKHYKNLVKKIRKKIPGVCLSTDVIVGFPGETKKQFENTVKLFKEIKFDMAYIAQYSARPGTAATKIKDDISRQEKRRRDKTLTEVLKQTALENNQRYIGKIVEALPEEIKDKFLTGKTKTYKTVKFEGTKDLIGRFIKVKIIDALPWGLKGVQSKL